jgi:hypothetical protein
MFVTWSTIDDTNGSFVEYGPEVGDEFRVEGTSTRFTEKGDLLTAQYIHRARLVDLVPGQSYGEECKMEMCVCA